jgi:hypothetical protein
MIMKKKEREKIDNFFDKDKYICKNCGKTKPKMKNSAKRSFTTFTHIFDEKS